jgi:hypothetical protein
LAKLFRDLPLKMVVAEIDLPDEGEIAERWRDTPRQAERVHLQCNDSLRMPKVANNSPPAAKVIG